MVRLGGRFPKLDPDTFESPEDLEQEMARQLAEVCTREISKITETSYRCLCCLQYLRMFYVLHMPIHARSQTNRRSSCMWVM